MPGLRAGDAGSTTCITLAETLAKSREGRFRAALAALTALAAAIRFTTLGLQSYRHDEAVTAGR
ncbi:MAG: hypothetical protein ACM3NV_02365, partial [Syntrophothermus sp.]